MCCWNVELVLGVEGDSRAGGDTVIRNLECAGAAVMLPSIRIDSWDDWTRVYNDVSVWRGLVDAICGQEGIGYRAIEAASANTNAVFLLDQAWALKIYSPFWDEFDFERSLLEGLGSQDEIPVPEVNGYGQIADGDGVEWSYLITRYCGERPFSEVRSELTDGEARSIATQLGGMARSLHELDVRRFANAATAEAWSEVVSQRRRAAAGELVAAGVVEAGVASSVDALLDEAMAADLAEARVVVHGDLGADHVLCALSEEGWRIETLIDFGDAKIGVREYEWMPVWTGFCGRDPVLARAFLDAYDPALAHDSQYAERAVAWSLLHDFGGDELISYWRERGRPRPFETMDELAALLCPRSIFG